MSVVLVKQSKRVELDCLCYEGLEIICFEHRGRYNTQSAT